MHHYRAFSLTFRSPQPIPSMAACEVSTDEPHDVEIIYGPVSPPANPENVDEMLVAADGDSLILQIPYSGRYKVTAGRLITVEPDPAATKQEVDTFLVGSVFGALLHQNGLLPLHGNAVEIDGEAFLFCGDSGAGKSTLAAYFQDKGYRLLTDDLCAVRFSADGDLLAWPGIARLKLWRDAMAQFERPTDGLPNVVWTDDKFEIPMRSIAQGGPFPVAAIYHLREADVGRPPGIHKLPALEAINTITANIYRRRLADLCGVTRNYISTSASIVKAIPVFTMNRQWGFESFQAEAENAESHMGEISRRLLAP